MSAGSQDVAATGNRAVKEYAPNTSTERWLVDTKETTNPPCGISELESQVRAAAVSMKVRRGRRKRTRLPR